MEGDADYSDDEGKSWILIEINDIWIFIMCQTMLNYSLIWYSQVSLRGYVIISIYKTENTDLIVGLKIKPYLRSERFACYPWRNKHLWYATSYPARKWILPVSMWATKKILSLAGWIPHTTGSLRPEEGTNCIVLWVYTPDPQKLWYNIYVFF